MRIRLTPRETSFYDMFAASASNLVTGSKLLLELLGADVAARPELAERMRAAEHSGDDITHAIDSTNRLLSIVASRNDTLDRVLTEFPPLIQHFAETRDLFADAVLAVGRISSAADTYLGQAADPLHTNLQNLQRPLKQLAKASPYLPGAFRLMLTLPFNIDTIPNLMRGDYINVSAVIDLTLSMVDNAILTGTGLSGSLRALEQSWGRDPATMIPDVRFTPNPHDAPNGPLVERGE